MRFAYYGREKPTEQLLYDMLLSSPPKLLAIDVESVSLEILEPVGIGIAVSPTDAFYFPVLLEPSPFLPDIINILRDASITKVFHNALFDLQVLAEYNIDQSNIIDTLIMAHLAGARDARLLTLALSAGRLLPSLPALKQWIFELTEEQIAEKCCSDAQATWVVYHHLLPGMDMDYLTSELQLLPILLAMSAKGIKITKNYDRNCNQIWKLKFLCMMN